MVKSTEITSPHFPWANTDVAWACTQPTDADRGACSVLGFQAETFPITPFPGTVTRHIANWDSFLTSSAVTHEWGRQDARPCSLLFISEPQPKSVQSGCSKMICWIKLALSSLSVLYVYNAISSPINKCPVTLSRGNWSGQLRALPWGATEEGHFLASPLYEV